MSKFSTNTGRRIQEVSGFYKINTLKHYLKIKKLKILIIYVKPALNAARIS